MMGRGQGQEEEAAENDGASIVLGYWLKTVAETQLWVAEVGG